MELPFFWKKALERSTLLDIETTGLDPARHAPLGAAHGRFTGPVQETWFTYETAERVQRGPWYRKFGIKTEEEIYNIMEPFARAEWEASWARARQLWLQEGNVPMAARKYFSRLIAGEARAGRFIWTHNVRFDITQFGSQFAHPAAQRMMWERAVVPGWTEWEPVEGRLYPTATRGMVRARGIAYERPQVASGAMRQWYGQYRTMVEEAVTSGKPAILDSLAMAQAMMGMAQETGAMKATGDLFTGASLEALTEAFRTKKPFGRAHLAATDVRMLRELMPRLIETTERLHAGKPLKGYQARALKILGEIQPEIATIHAEKMFAQARYELAQTGSYRLSRGGYSRNLADILGIYKQRWKQRSYYQAGKLEGIMEKVKRMSEEEISFVLTEKAKIPTITPKVAIAGAKAGVQADIRRFIAGRNPLLIAGVAALAAYGVGQLLLPKRKDHNTVESLRKEGMAGFQRHLVTDFGSGYRKKLNVKPQGDNEEKSGISFWKVLFGLAIAPTMLQIGMSMAPKVVDLLPRYARFTREMLTGRATMFHGTTAESAESILQTGLKKEFAAREGSITHELLIKELGQEAGQYKGLTYLTRQRMEGVTYAEQSKALAKGKTRQQAQAGAIWRQFDPRTWLGKHKGLVEFRIPTWKEEFRAAQRLNPEIAQYGEEGWKGLYERVIRPQLRQQAIPLPEFLMKHITRLQFNKMRKSVAYARDIGSEYIPRSSQYQRLTMEEWKTYSALHPGRVAAGVGMAAAPAAAAGTVGYWHGDNDTPGHALDGMSERGLAPHIRKIQTDFGSKTQELVAIGKWIARFGERRAAQAIKQGDTRELLAFLRGKIRETNSLRIGKSSIGFEMTDAQLMEHISTIKKLNIDKGSIAGKVEHGSRTAIMAQKKELLRKTITQATRTGEVEVGAAIRSTDIDELNYILRKSKLRMGLSFEGAPGISATQITNRLDPAIPMYGSYEKTPVAIIAREHHLMGPGESVREMLINPKTRVEELRFVIPGEEKAHILSYQQLEGFLEKKRKLNRIRTKMVQNVQKENAPGGVPGVRLDDSPGVPGMPQKMHNNRKGSHMMYQR